MPRQTNRKRHTPKIPKDRFYYGPRVKGPFEYFAGFSCSGDFGRFCGVGVRVRWCVGVGFIMTSVRMATLPRTLVCTARCRFTILNTTYCRRMFHVSVQALMPCASMPKTLVCTARSALYNTLRQDARRFWNTMHYCKHSCPERACRFFPVFCLFVQHNGIST